MKRVGLVLMAMLAASGVFGQGAASSDRNKLLGDWELVSISFGGKQMDLPNGKNLKLTFQAEKIIAFEGDVKKEETPYKLDETKKPKQIEVEKMAGDNKPGFKGIYQLEGDQLKIAIGLQMDVPPKSFEGDQLIVMTLKRSPRKKE